MHSDAIPKQLELSKHETNGNIIVLQKHLLLHSAHFIRLILLNYTLHTIYAQQYIVVRVLITTNYLYIYSFTIIQL